MKKILFTTDNKGISLVEAVLTICILSLALVSSMQAIQGVVSNLNFSDKEIIATQLASEKLENIVADKMALGYNHVVPSNYPDEILSGPFTGYKRKVHIVDVTPGDLKTPAAPGQILKKVEVKVGYGPDPSENVVVTGLVGKY